MTRVAYLNAPTKGLAFVRLLIAEAKTDDPEAAEHFAAKRWGADSLAARIAKNGGSDVLASQKAAVAAGSTLSSNWAELLAETATAGAEFFGLVAERSLIGRIAGLRRVPFDTRLINAVTGLSAAWIGEGVAVPVSKAAFGVELLPPRKVASVSVVTQELINSADPAAELLIRDTMAQAVAEAIDLAFIDPTNDGVANVKPASVTYGVTPTTGGGDALGDVRALIDDFPGDLGRAVLVGSPNRFADMHDPMLLPNIGVRGGNAMGIPAVPSKAAGETLALIDPDGIALGGGETIFTVARQASIEMLDNPTNNSVTPTPTTTVSLWQTNAVATMAESVVNWETARPSVAVLETVS